MGSGGSKPKWGDWSSTCESGGTKRSWSKLHDIEGSWEDACDDCVKTRKCDGPPIPPGDVKCTKKSDGMYAEVKETGVQSCLPTWSDWTREWDDKGCRARYFSKLNGVKGSWETACDACVKDKNCNGPIIPEGTSSCETKVDGVYGVVSADKSQVDSVDLQSDDVTLFCLRSWGWQGSSQKDGGFTFVGSHGNGDWMYAREDIKPDENLVCEELWFRAAPCAGGAVTYNQPVRIEPHVHRGKFVKCGGGGDLARCDTSGEGKCGKEEKAGWRTDWKVFRFVDAFNRAKTGVLRYGDLVRLNHSADLGTAAVCVVGGGVVGLRDLEHENTVFEVVRATGSKHFKQAEIQQEIAAQKKSQNSSVGFGKWAKGDMTAAKYQQYYARLWGSTFGLKGVQDCSDGTLKTRPGDRSGPEYIDIYNGLDRVTRLETPIGDMPAVAHCINKGDTQGIWASVYVPTDDAACTTSAKAAETPPASSARPASIRTTSGETLEIPEVETLAFREKRYGPGPPNADASSLVVTEVMGSVALRKFLPEARRPITSDALVTLMFPNWVAGQKNKFTFLKGEAATEKGLREQTETAVGAGAGAGATVIGVGAVAGAAAGGIYAATIGTAGVLRTDDKAVPGKLGAAHRFQIMTTPYCQCSLDGRIKYGQQIVLRIVENNTYVRCGGGTCSPYYDPENCDTDSWQAFRIIPGPTSLFQNNAQIGDDVCFGDSVRIAQGDGENSIGAADNGSVWLCTADGCQGAGATGGWEVSNSQILILPQTGTLYDGTGTKSFISGLQKQKEQTYAIQNPFGHKFDSTLSNFGKMFPLLVGAVVALIVVVVAGRLIFLSKAFGHNGGRTGLDVRIAIENGTASVSDKK